MCGVVITGEAVLDVVSALGDVFQQIIALGISHDHQAKFRDVDIDIFEWIAIVGTNSKIGVFFYLLLGFFEVEIVGFKGGFECVEICL